MAYIQALVFILIAEVAGLLGALFTSTGAGTWYQTIVKPSWNPPNWLFGPVWTTLYALMGIAAFLVWRLPASTLRTQALILYGLQLLVNASWSFVFFGGESPRYGLLVIVILLGLIIATTMKFFALSKTTGWLMVPYILWVTFATILNFTILRLNP